MEHSIWVITAEHAWQIKQSIKELEKQHDLLLSHLKALANNKNHVEGNYFLKKDIRSGSVDYSKIELLKQIDLEPYRRPSVESWKLERIHND